MVMTPTVSLKLEISNVPPFMMRLLESEMTSFAPKASVPELIVVAPV